MMVLHTEGRQERAAEVNPMVYRTSAGKYEVFASYGGAAQDARPGTTTGGQTPKSRCARHRARSAVTRPGARKAAERGGPCGESRRATCPPCAEYEARTKNRSHPVVCGAR